VENGKLTHVSLLNVDVVERQSIVGRSVRVRLGVKDTGFGVVQRMSKRKLPIPITMLAATATKTMRKKVLQPCELFRRRAQVRRSRTMDQSKRVRPSQVVPPAIQERNGDNIGRGIITILIPGSFILRQRITSALPQSVVFVRNLV